MADAVLAETTDSGTSRQAADAIRDACQHLPPPERVFRQSGIARSLTDLVHAGSELRELLSMQRLERAIGVVYRPESELSSHYFAAVLPQQFDAYVWFEGTHAVEPLSSQPGNGVPDTYPFGV